MTITHPMDVRTGLAEVPVQVFLCDPFLLEQTHVVPVAAQHMCYEPIFGGHDQHGVNISASVCQLLSQIEYLVCECCVFLPVRI